MCVRIVPAEERLFRWKGYLLPVVSCDKKMRDKTVSLSV